MERNKLSNSGSKKMEGGKSRCTVLAFSFMKVTGEVS